MIAWVIVLRVSPLVQLVQLELGHLTPEVTYFDRPAPVGRYTLPNDLFEILLTAGSLGSEGCFHFELVLLVSLDVSRVQFLLQFSHRTGATYFFNHVTFGAWCVSLPGNADFAVWTSEDCHHGLTVLAWSLLEEMFAALASMVGEGAVIDTDWTTAFFTSKVLHRVGVYTQIEFSSTVFLCHYK